MKKNKMMRIAAVLLIVTLLSTCVISGTFAKYVAKATMDDSARVAKWGIKIETSGSLFSEKYEADDADYIAAGGEYSVEAFNGEDKVVAPGTTSYTYDSNGEVTDMGFTARLSGKPEVATRFSLKLSGLKDVFLPFDNGYTDYSEAVVDGEEQTFDLLGPGTLGTHNEYVKGYSPVKWNVKVTRVKDDGTIDDSCTSISLADIASSVASDMGYDDLFEGLFTAEGVSITDAKTIVEQVERLGLEDTLLEQINDMFTGHGFRNLSIKFEDVLDEQTGEVVDKDIILSMDFDPNENCNYLFEGGWTWAYEQSAPSFIGSAQSANYVDMCNKADTYLGNAAADIVSKTSPSGKAVSTDLSFGFVASATQID